MKKKAFLLGPILTLIAIVLLGTLLARPLYTYVADFFGGNNTGVAAPEEPPEFQPYQPSTMVATSELFDSYVIAYSAKVEIEEGVGTDDNRHWSFYRKFDVGDSIKAEDTIKIPADYHYNSCTASSSELRMCYPEIFDKEECRCTSWDEESDGYNAMASSGLSPSAIDKAKVKRLAATNRVDYVYNIMLITYKNGKEVCRSTTTTGKLLDTGLDGLQGNEVNCRNSQTWVQCNGTRVYYCGKLDYTAGAGQFAKDYYFEEGPEGIQNRAGILTYVHVDPSEYKKALYHAVRS